MITFINTYTHINICKYMYVIKRNETTVNQSESCIGNRILVSMNVT